ncbi:MAG: HAD hydrolase family protein [Bacteroidales bacterium]|nr:HAD hydrolase family protein [Bacteroidales bacterium]
MRPDYTRIRAIAYDIDGVMTDGGIFCDSSGDLLRTYDAKDSFSVRMARMQGYPVGIITGGESRSITSRAESCGIDPEDVYLKSANKLKDFKKFCERHSLSPDEVMYFGDDLPDVPVLEACGIGVAPCDACAEAKEAADVVSKFPGGKGCVRSAIEAALKSRGLWRLDIEEYERKY